MKKMIIPALAALLFCGAANAQLAQKAPQKGITTAASKTTVKKPVTTSASSVTPMKTTTKTSAATAAVPKKRHHKVKPKGKVKK